MHHSLTCTSRSMHNMCSICKCRQQQQFLLNRHAFADTVNKSGDAMNARSCCILLLSNHVYDHLYMDDHPRNHLYCHPCQAVQQVCEVSPARGKRSDVTGRWHTNCAHRAPEPHSPGECSGRSDTGSRPEYCSQQLCSQRLLYAPTYACCSQRHR